MSREYAESRIRKALELCKGNPTRARQQVIAWTFEDQKLLQALAQPHLTGIVAHAIGRVIHRQNIEGHDDSAAETSGAPEALDIAPDTFGKEILQILSSQNTAMFGREGVAPPVRRKQASQRHVDALKQMARKNKDS